MDEFTRRSALTLGTVAAAGLPLLAVATPASAEMYAADAGEEVMPGVRMVALGEWPVDFGGYKRAVANDYIAAPGMGFPEEAMKNDMLCHVIEGEFNSVVDGKEVVFKTGQIYSCHIGTVASDLNKGSAPAVMRVIDLFPV